MSADHRDELRLRWILGICLGLMLGYIWGQYDANSAPTVAIEAHP